MTETSNSNLEIPTYYYDMGIGEALLYEQYRPLTDKEIEDLWSIVERIQKAWEFTTPAFSMKPQWLDYLRATTEQHSAADSPSLLGEYINAVAVHNELINHNSSSYEALFLFREVKFLSNASSRLDHAKYFVVDRFMKCYVMLAGFMDFGGRNYGGYMGGSRFADTDPVRIGDRK